MAGILASNSDVTDLFVDSALKICGGDLAAFDHFLTNLDKLTKGSDLHILMTVSLPIEDATEIQPNGGGKSVTGFLPASGFPFRFSVPREVTCVYR